MMELLLKASFALVVVFLFYKLLLQQESFFTINRFYLLAGLLLAFVLPFVTLPKLMNHQGYLTTVWQPANNYPSNSIHPKAPVNEINLSPEPARSSSVSTSTPVQNEASTPKKLSNSATFSGLFWLGGLYLFGVMVFSISLLFQVGSLFYKILRTEDKIYDGEVVIVNTTHRQAPCSFFKYIFIYPDDYDFETYEQILAHEKIHVRLRHSVDLLLAELAVIVLWFNPIIWLLKREIEKNNEYQTDALLLAKEPVSPEHYQLNLLQIAVPNKPLSITTNYNQSLLKQRIMMMNAKKSTPHAYWKYSFLVPLFFGTILMMNEPATSQELPISDILLPMKPISQAKPIKENVFTTKVAVNLARKPPKPSKPKGKSLPIQSNDSDMSAGYWYSHQEGNEYCLELKGSRNNTTWNMSQCFDKKLFQKTGNEVYKMNNEVGTLQLTGNLEAEVGQGKYTFTEKPAFKQYLASNNLVAKDKNLLFHLFFAGVNRAYVDFLKKNYAEVTGDRLLEVAIHDVSLADHQSYITMFQEHSHKKPSLQEVLEAKIHGIDKEYVQELGKMGFKDLSMKKMIEAKIHDVDPAYVANLKKAGFPNLTMDKIIQANIHDINPESVKELRALGFGDLSLDKMIELNIHNVNAGYIQELQSAGLKNLALEQVLEARIHDLNPASIKAIRDLGFKDLDFSELVKAQIHDVDAAYIAELKEAGFPNLSMDKVVEAKIHDVDGTFIKQARQKGYNFNKLDKYIALKIHNSAIEALKE
ncbi:hypothetical protein AHMF7605_27665 [Adhaeribacter arboris]|uniref:Peptidase M56 domain-containing protein n=1 Tax=Adhaeribacter arboris TaxID=2072846 RepID=A0A2T2YNA2_9BACT|nr:M56 family metallopeptidase [Adhaeribacter arboris]PSR56994.1 hypothetical protein AHMF7605_27665 [Adhaeribacter arboris]